MSEISQSFSKEVYKPVPGMDGMEVNSDGTLVKYLDEYKFVRFSKRGAKGYRYKVVYIGNKTYPVHRLVYAAWIGKPIRRITFKDGNRLNCFYKNLLPQPLHENIKALNVDMQPIKGWPDAYINNNGTIITQFGYEVPIGKIKCGDREYLRACLMKYGKSYDVYVAHLVARTFLPSFSINKTKVIHLDTNTTNNHYKNLKWANEVELYQFHVANGMSPLPKQRDLRHNSKIKKTDIIFIIHKLKDGKTLNEIAKEYNTSDMSISRIKNRYLTDEEKMEINKKKNVATRISPQTIQIIRRLLRSGKHTVSAIAEMCAVSSGVVYRIRKQVKNHTIKI